MQVHVRLFASLRERLGFGDRAVVVEDGQTILDIWHTITGDADVPPNVLMAVNQVYAPPDTRVSDGDEIAFFPPVTGG
jgi:sulfur-carrier protein